MLINNHSGPILFRSATLDVLSVDDMFLLQNAVTLVEVSPIFSLPSELCMVILNAFSVDFGLYSRLLFIWYSTLSKHRTNLIDRD